MVAKLFWICFGLCFLLFFDSCLDNPNLRGEIQFYEALGDSNVTYYTEDSKWCKKDSKVKNNINTSLYLCYEDSAYSKLIEFDSLIYQYDKYDDPIYRFRMVWNEDVVSDNHSMSSSKRNKQRDFFNEASITRVTFKGESIFKEKHVVYFPTLLRNTKNSYQSILDTIIKQIELPEYVKDTLSQNYFIRYQINTDFKFCKNKNFTIIENPLYPLEYGTGEKILIEGRYDCMKSDRME